MARAGEGNLKWVVAPGPASVEMARSLAKKLGAEIVEVECRVFPDGESKIRVQGKVADSPVLVVQSAYPPVDTHIMQLLMISHRLSEEGALICAVVPYLGYARQDRAFLEGEVVSLGVLSRLLRAVGVRRLATVDIHGVAGLGQFSFPAYSVSAIPAIAEHFSTRRLGSPLVVSPDLGASARAEALSQLLGTRTLILKKTRDRSTGAVTMERPEASIEGSEVIMIDDIISTGGTVVEATRILRELGARKVYAACTHPILAGDALDRMKAAGVDEVVGTNTIPSPVSTVDVVPALSRYLSTL